jgi:hypothetical protein
MLGIALTTMNRFSFLKESLPVFLDHPGVSEVVVCDETGEDYDAILSTPSFYTNKKLRVIKNKKRLGIYKNKCKALSLSTAAHVAVLDSDNHFSEEWIDTILETLQTTGPKTILASAEFRNTNIMTGEVSYPCKEFSDLRLDMHTWNDVFKKPRWNFLLNDGNWVVPRESILCLPENVESESLLAADAIFMLQNFIKGGYAIHYVPGLSYLHVVHDGSTWLETEKESTRILNTMPWRI